MYDVMEFDVRTNTKELEKNLKLQGFPSDLQDKVNEMVTEYRDVFFEDGFRRSVRGFSFQIDICSHSPICCKPPRYIPHGERLGENGVVEEYDGPWGSLVGLSAKPHQENVP